MAYIILRKPELDLIFFLQYDFRGGSRRAKLRKRYSPTDNKKMTAIEMTPLKEPLATAEINVTTDDLENESPEETEAGWSSILFAVLKILILGIAIFIYDIYSK